MMCCFGATLSVIASKQALSAFAMSWLYCCVTGGYVQHRFLGGERVYVHEGGNDERGEGGVEAGK